MPAERYTGAFRYLDLRGMLPPPPSMGRPYETVGTRSAGWDNPIRTQAAVILKYSSPRWNRELKEQMAEGVIALCRDWGEIPTEARAMEAVNTAKAYTGQSYLMHNPEQSYYVNTVELNMHDVNWRKYRTLRVPATRLLILEER